MIDVNSSLFTVDDNNRVFNIDSSLWEQEVGYAFSLFFDLTFGWTLLVNWRSSGRSFQTIFLTRVGEKYSAIIPHPFSRFNDSETPWARFDESEKVHCNREKNEIYSINFDFLLQLNFLPSMDRALDVRFQAESNFIKPHHW